MKRLLVLMAVTLCAHAIAQPTHTATPDQLYGELFREIQLKRILPDGKTFVDCTPKRKVADIMYDYGIMKGPGFDLKKFVADNFILPQNPQIAYHSNQQQPLTEHIRQLWTALKRNPDSLREGSTLLPLPNPYIVPGGRFREIYYWDSYFTMLGLKESGEWETIEHMIDNFAFLLQTYGHIPNGNRSYYLSRSQPPYFAMMVNLLAEHKGNDIYRKYRIELQAEYAYWMDKTAATKHVVYMPDGNILNRYYDADDHPRQESFKEDEEVSEQVANGNASTKSRVNRDLRSGAESGWDFSTRWFADGTHISTIQTTNIVPVDLNGLLYQLELTLAKAARADQDAKNALSFEQEAATRKATLNKYCFNAKKNWYFDYLINEQRQNTQETVAGFSPMFFNIAPKTKAVAMAAHLQRFFLKPGGVVTTLKHSGQQWDAPNGWAPLQWMSIKGLENYGQLPLAKNLATRWVSLNERVYQATGKMMEKYNVENIALEAGGGEYPSQDGFGWTNGVYLAVKAKLDKWKKTVRDPLPASKVQVQKKP